MNSPIIVALDVPAADQALRLATEVGPYVGAVKIGKELFVSAGPEVVRKIRSQGVSVFLDLKFHDIPNTVAKAVAGAVRLDVQMLTVHTSGGPAMLEAAERSARETARQCEVPPPLVLGVTVLTSMDQGELHAVGVETSVAGQVERLANLAVRAGLRGLVCSPLEIVSLRQALPGEMQLVTPGIRSTPQPAEDQRRTLSAREAMQAGADWLVIGRPITAAADPARAAREILDSIQARGE